MWKWPFTLCSINATKATNASPRGLEHFHVRLLQQIPGPQSYEDLGTIYGAILDTI